MDKEQCGPPVLLNYVCLQQWHEYTQFFMEIPDIFARLF
jgi:hypothetical protein